MHRFAERRARARRSPALGHHRPVRAGARRPRVRSPRAIPSVESIGIDTWGVDYGLLDADGSCSPTRSPTATIAPTRVVDAVHSRVGTRPSSTAINGLQFLPFNTMLPTRGRARDGPPGRASRTSRCFPTSSRTGSPASCAPSTPTRPRPGSSTCTHATGPPPLLDAIDVSRTRCSRRSSSPATVRGTVRAERRARTRALAVHGRDDGRIARHRVGRRRRARHRSRASPTCRAARGRSSASSSTSRSSPTTRGPPTSPTKAASTDASASCATSAGSGCCRSAARVGRNAATHSDLAALLAEAEALAGRRPDLRRRRPAFIGARRHADAHRRRDRGAAAMRCRRHRRRSSRCIVDSLAARLRADDRRRPKRRAAAAVDVVHIVGGGSQNALLCRLTAGSAACPSSPVRSRRPHSATCSCKRARTARCPALARRAARAHVASDDTAPSLRKQLDEAGPDEQPPRRRSRASSTACPWTHSVSTRRHRDLTWVTDDGHRRVDADGVRDRGRRRVATGASTRRVGLRRLARAGPDVAIAASSCAYGCGAPGTRRRRGATAVTLEAGLLDARRLGRDRGSAPPDAIRSTGRRRRRSSADRSCSAGSDRAGAPVRHLGRRPPLELNGAGRRRPRAGARAGPATATASTTRPTTSPRSCRTARTSSAPSSPTAGGAAISSWEMERNVYGDRLGLLAQLEITYDDGSHRGDRHRRRMAHGRRADPRRRPLQRRDLRRAARASTAGRARLRRRRLGRRRGRSRPTVGALVAPAGPPVRRIEELPVQRGADDAVGPHDPRLRAEPRRAGPLHGRGRAGTTVTLRHAEVLEHGELGTRPLRNAEATDRYTSRGGDPETWEPTFTFHGFRYVEVDGWPGAVDPADFIAVVIHSDLERTGTFACSNELLNRLHENVVWGMRGNFVDVPTDCPQRDERLGWTGDLQVFAPTAAFLYDVDGFLAGWLDDLARRADATTASFPIVVPRAPEHLAFVPAAAWGDAATIVPWVLYERYGDVAVLGRQLDSMRGVGRLRRERGRAGPALWPSGFQLGDWLDPDAPPDEPCAGEDRRRRSSPPRTSPGRRRSSATPPRCSGDPTSPTTTPRPRRATCAQAFRDEYVTPNGRLMLRLPHRVRARARIRPARDPTHRARGTRLRARLRARRAATASPPASSARPSCCPRSTQWRRHRDRVPAPHRDRLPVVALPGDDGRDDDLGALGQHAARRLDQPRRDDLVQPLRARQRRRLDAPHDRRPRAPTRPATAALRIAPVPGARPDARPAPPSSRRTAPHPLRGCSKVRSSRSR